jgi:hypothetical protein
MADIFISYSKPHVELTRDLASDLEAKGLTVWWDTDLLAGESFRQRIIQELHDCKAAIVIWTPQSVTSDYVISEAERARKAGKLIQIRTEEVEPDALPPPFDTGHASLIDDRKATLDPHGKQVWATLGATDVLTIDEARERARKAIQRVKDGKPAFEAPPAKVASFEEIAEQWLKRHVRAKGLRSAGEVTRLLKAHVYSAWKGRAFLAIRRSDVAALLDDVEDDHGARQADYVLAIVRGVMNWYATRHDDYVPPIVKGARTRRSAPAAASSRTTKSARCGGSQRHIRCACPPAAANRAAA